MRLADEALTARRAGETQTATQLFRAAFEAERDAALALTSDHDIEPTRSILFRSAGFLALDCGELQQAKRMAAAGLCGSPPADIAEQLRDLLARKDT